MGHGQLVKELALTADTSVHSAIANDSAFERIFGR